MNGTHVDRSPLDAQTIARALRTKRYGRSLRVLSRTDSTNDDARREAASGAPEGHVVLADSQRAGRGSNGRSWLSPPGSDLYLSIVTRPRLSLSALPPLTLAVGLGVSECIHEVLRKRARDGTATRVKWPNDVWLDGKKCAGILVEALAQPTGHPTLVVGIGLNVNRDTFPPELAESSTALRATLKEDAVLDRGAVLCALLLSVERWVDRFVDHGGAVVAGALDAVLAMRGERVRCGSVEGTLLGVAASGAIRVRTAGGERELVAGRLERPMRDATT